MAIELGLEGAVCCSRVRGHSGTRRVVVCRGSWGLLLRQLCSSLSRPRAKLDLALTVHFPSLPRTPGPFQMSHQPTVTCACGREEKWPGHAVFLEAAEPEWGCHRAQARGSKPDSAG